MGLRKLLNLLAKLIPAIVAVVVFDWLKLQRNNVEDEGVVERAEHHVAPGLAMAFFRYIENVVKGVTDEDGNEINKPHDKALNDWIVDQGLASNVDWICPKILILFPESDQIKGSVHDIAAREKLKNENHCLTLDTIHHEYMAAGQ